MAGFLYFLPGVEKKPTNAAAIPAEYGLATIFDGEPFDGAAYIHGGPESKSGVIVPMSGVAPLYKPDDQVWEKFGDPEYWIGFDRKNPPGPGDLARKQQIAGVGVKLNDENEWAIPIVHAENPDENGEPISAIPRLLHMNGRGPELVFDPRYSSVIEKTRMVFESHYEDKPWPWQMLESMVFCVELLAINYRIRLEEASALKLVGTNHAFALTAAAMGLTIVDQEIEAQKKSVIASSG